MSTCIIAEAAGTHGGDFDRAYGLLEDVAAFGANAFKLQFWSDSAKVAARLNAPELVALYASVRTPAEWLPRLSSAAHARGMEFLCTVDLVEDIPVVAPYVDRFKIASVEAHDQAFIDAHAKYGKPLLISLGMDAAPMWSVWMADVPFTYLHCISGYPTPVDEANLGRIQRDHALTGFSDHTANVLTGAFAVCAGAGLLEVHVKADDTPADNPDAPHSLTPAQFREYVANVRLAERMLGTGEKRVMPSEVPTLRHRVRV